MIEEFPRRVRARRGSSVIYKGKTLLSLIDPEGQAIKVCATLPVLKQTLYICPSPLFGYGLRELIGRMAVDSAILCVESDAGLMQLSAEEIPSDILSDPRLRFARTGTAESLCSFVRREFGPRRFRRAVLAKFSGGYALDADSYNALENALRADIALGWSNAMTLVKLGRRYALNSIRNLSLLPMAKCLDETVFGGSPILVLGAGPSLDSVAPLLRTKRNYRIVCVDTALKPLLDRRIQPDLVVALEAQQWNLRDFIGSSRFRCALAMDLSSLPGGAYATGGERYLFSSEWTQLRYLDRLRSSGLLPSEIPPLGSVGLAAVAAALRAGTGPVLIAGLDFAYGIGEYHARSAPSRQELLIRGNRLKSLIDPGPAFREGVVGAADKFGLPTRTDPALRGYRSLFEREFAGIGRLIDAGGRGLPLGIKKATLGDAERILSETAPSGIPGRTNSKRPPAAAVRAFIENELDMLQSLRSALTGASAASGFDGKIDDCDYLWAHFPECAGAEGRHPPATDLAFMKRVRAEIDPFMKAFRIALAEL